MGWEKRTIRRARSGSTRTDSDSSGHACCHARSIIESGTKPLPCHLTLNELHHHHHIYHHFLDHRRAYGHTCNHHAPHATADEIPWGYCTEEQLEEILMKNLEFLYKEAVGKLVGLGYDEEVAMKAILTNGHCYGGMDVLTNILHNALAHLNSKNGAGVDGVESGEESGVSGFSDLRQLEEYSLAGMICLLQQVRPQLSRGDAMWCLLMSDLHVGRAGSIEIPLGSGNGSGIGENVSGTMQIGLESAADRTDGNGVGVVAPALCRFHGGWGFGNGETGFHKDIDCPKRFNLSPSMKSLLKRNVALFSAGFKANSKNVPAQSPGQSQPSLPVDAINGVTALANNSEESQDSKNTDGVSSMLSKFRDLNLDESFETGGEGQKDEIILSLLHQIKDLDRQVKERKEWAHQKAMQAARKLSNDLTELKLLRIEREETQRLKKGKHTLEDSTMKRLSEMENALRKASGQVDRANAAVRRLETENAEIRAEMEASKLSASESVASCLEFAKREKKCLKKILAWEKQKNRLQEEITDEKEKIIELQGCLAQVEQSQKYAEGNWRQELKAKEQAVSQVEEERRAKEAAEANSKRKLESLRLKIEIDFQRHKDDLQRLEQELSRLRSSMESAKSKTDSAKSQGDTIARLLNQLDEKEDLSETGDDRECIICMKDEVSVVFLPCAHQVLCASCSDNYGKKGKATCPCCRAPIEQRIRVFGASS